MRYGNSGMPDRKNESLQHVADRLQKEVDSLVSGKRIKHAILAVETGDKSFGWTGVAGDASPDGTPMRSDTPFFLASITKLYIATVVMRLHEQGLIALDSPMSAYLPDSLIAGLHRLKGIDYTDKITVRHLLSHTSGLPDYLEEGAKGKPGLLERVFTGEDMTLGIAIATRTVREDLTPHFPPQPMEASRQKARYSDTNYQLLIAIIEAVTGHSLHEAFEEYLYRPLNLVHTYHPGHAPLEPVRKEATVWVDGRPLDRPKALQSLGDLYSTADDVLAFMRALVRGEAFDHPNTFGLMQARWNRFGFPLDKAALRSPNWPIEYGLGIMRFQIPRILAPLHPMPAVIGHTGSTGSWLFYCPDLDLYLCGTLDEGSAGPLPYRILPKILRMMRE